jgi:hypothetical protein
MKEEEEDKENQENEKDKEEDEEENKDNEEDEAMAEEMAVTTKQRHTQQGAARMDLIFKMANIKVVTYHER